MIMTDNGQECVHHEKIAKDLDVEIYFTQPCSS